MSQAISKGMLAFLLWLLLLPDTAQAQSLAQDKELLEVGKTYSQEITAAQPHRYRIALQKGEFIQFLLTLKDTQLGVALLSPKGEPVAAFQESNLGEGFMSLSILVAESGEYQYEVKVPLPQGTFHYDLKLVARRPAQPRDALQLEAEKKMLTFWSDPPPQQLVTISAVLKLYQQLDDKFGQAVMFVMAARMGVGVVPLAKQVADFEQALALFRAIRNREGELSTLYLMGMNYVGFGQYEQARQCHQRGVELSRAEGLRDDEKLHLKGLGDVYQFLGDYTRAIASFEAALAISREPGYETASTLLSYGRASLLQGEWEKAMEQFTSGLMVSQQIGHEQLQLMFISSLSSVARMRKRPEQEREYLQQGLVLAHATPEHKNLESGLLTALGEVHWQLNQPEKAVEYFAQSLALAREIHLLISESFGLYARAGMFRAQQQYAQSMADLGSALRIIQGLNNPEAEANILTGMMLTAEAARQPDSAALFGKLAVNTYQKMRSSLAGFDPNVQQGFLSATLPGSQPYQRSETYRKLADILIAQGRLPEAEQVIRMLKEEEYFEFIRRDNDAPNSNKATLTSEEAALEKRFREIAESLIEIGEQRSSLLAKPTRSAEENTQLTKLESDLSLANQKFQQFLDTISTELSRKPTARQTVFQLRESQGLMEDLRELGKGVAALYTLVGEEKFRIILTNADVQKAYEFPIKGTELNRKVLALRDALQNRNSDPRSAAQELYKILIGPIAKDLNKMNAKTLMWSLDGVLRYVPVAALYDGEKYLIERYNNIVFTPASNARLKDAPRAKWQALGLGVTRGFENVPPLPAVAEEMRSIIKDEAVPNANGILPGTIKLDDQFTQESMLTALRTRPAVVHVASHFQFKPGNETNSALLLGDGKLLSLAQIKTMPNVFSGVELLTLSACNTATGSATANGKEVEGFGVLAQRQGAKAVVASLWPVDDRTTRMLMEEFYRGREASKLSKGEALRQAQIKLLRGELKRPAKVADSREIAHENAAKTTTQARLSDVKRPFQHPYYWAPFIMIGNWR